MAVTPQLAEALATASAKLPPGRVDRVWVFPPRRTGEKETGLAVLAVYADEDPSSERRGVWTLGYEAEPLKDGRFRRTDSLVEQAVAPAGRVERVIEGVLRRLGTETEQPRVHEIRGDGAKWAELLAEGGVQLDFSSQE